MISQSSAIDINWHVQTRTQHKTNSFGLRAIQSAVPTATVYEFMMCIMFRALNVMNYQRACKVDDAAYKNIRDE